MVRAGKKPFADSGRTTRLLYCLIISSKPYLLLTVAGYLYCTINELDLI